MKKISLQKFVRIALSAAAWGLIADCAARMMLFFLRGEAFSGAWSFEEARVALAPAVVGGMEAYFWLFFFRTNRPPARPVAALAGIFLLIGPVLAPMLGLAVAGFSANPPHLALYAAIAAAHLGYALVPGNA